MNFNKMDIKTESYSVWYDTSQKTVFFQGTLRLNGMDEYAPIVDLLNNILEQEPPLIILNLQELNFLNSSGINIISKFVINVRNKKNMQMIVIGSEQIPWQSKSLKNLQRLMPNLKLDFSQKN